jgi:Zn-dependent protease with chaperone function
VRFWLIGLAAVLAAHVVVQAAASLVAACAYRVTRSRIGGLAPARRAGTLLTLALLPAAAGLVCAGLAAVAWLIHEPRQTAEVPGPILLALAAGALALGAVRAAPAAADAARTRRLVARFRRDGEEIEGLPLPATRAVHGFPVAGLAGAGRPRLLFAQQVLDALRPDELEAVVAHELAHHAARDTLKRLLLGASPDLLALTGAGRRLRAAFLEAAEAAADARACERVAPTTLARAIVKVAALVPGAGRLDLAMAGFHHEGGLARRVRHLLDATPRLGATAPPREPGAGDAPRVAPLALLAMGAAAAFAAASIVLPALHAALERLVHLPG